MNLGRLSNGEKISNQGAKDKGFTYSLKEDVFPRKRRSGRADGFTGLRELAFLSAGQAGGEHQVKRTRTWDE